tara:strand:- start:6 stop:161 length:156 start_codon:yes stop_codon:yes gene_type:complete
MIKRFSPEHLTKNKLWDSDWLREKYPERFGVGEYKQKDIIYDENGELWDVL